MAELKSKKMKTKHGGMFIALKYGAAAMAGATASYVFLKQEHELALLLARGDALDRRAARVLGHTKPTGPDPHLIAAANAADRLRQLHNTNYEL